MAVHVQVSVSLTGLSESYGMPLSWHTLVFHTWWGSSTYSLNEWTQEKKKIKGIIQDSQIGKE